MGRCLIVRPAVLLAIAGCSRVECDRASLERAIRSADPAPVREVADRCPMNPRPEDEVGFPLHIAALVGPLTTVELFLSRGAVASTLDHAGRTPLHWAVRRTDAEGLQVAALLIARGADVNLADGASLVPLRHAIGPGKGPMRDLLVAGGAKVAPHARSILADAVHLGDVESALWILARGADPHEKGPGGRSAADIALGKGDEALLRALTSTPSR
jgi:ankyrin repeat protein